MPKQIIVRINKKTGKITQKVEGIDGPGCLEDADVKALEKLIGFTGAACELTPEYFKAPEVQQHVGGENEV